MPEIGSAESQCGIRIQCSWMPPLSPLSFLQHVLVTSESKRDQIFHEGQSKRKRGV